jgi:hypothetical protein
MKKNSSKFRLRYYVISNFVTTNNENFKILKDMVDFYLRYKKVRSYNADAIKLH